MLSLVYNYLNFACQFGLSFAVQDYVLGHIYIYLLELTAQVGRHYPLFEKCANNI